MEQTASEERRVAALVGLSLLEVIRARDLPSEIIDSENPAETMPRRLGLTEAVEQQIRRFRREVRRRGRISDAEVAALFALVLRRPDAREVFFQAGELLAGKDAPARGLGRWLPRALRFALARRYFRRRFRALFGRSLGGFARGPFALEAGNHFLLELEPGGKACALLSGFAQTILSRYLGQSVSVTHSSCAGVGQEICCWLVNDL